MDKPGTDICSTLEKGDKMANTGYRTTGGTIGRVFGGKQYLLTAQESTKPVAQAVARDLRRVGFLARVYKNPDPKGAYRWWVFRRVNRGAK